MLCWRAIAVKNLWPAPPNASSTFIKRHPTNEAATTTTINCTTRISYLLCIRLASRAAVTQHSAATNTRVIAKMVSAMMAWVVTASALASSAWLVDAACNASL